MASRDRREFLAQLGQGVLVATVGYGAAFDLGLTRLAAEDEPLRLQFGPREPLVSLMQETPAEQTMAMLVGQLRQGVALQDLVAAGALANARTFGGEDYIGFHTFMALVPAWNMAQRLPESQRALPVLKVLYRNGQRMQEKGGRREEALHALPVSDLTVSDSDAVHQAVRARDLPRAEALLAATVARSPEDGYNQVLPAVADAVEVHRTVLAYRAWDLLSLVGQEHATTLLRQSLHYCVDNCDNYGNRFDGLPGLLAKLLDQYHLEQGAPGTRIAEDAWLEATSESLLRSTPDQGADLVAAALAEGIAPDSIADAVALAANQLVLRDPGRQGRQIQPHKPAGSVHGDSIGVHASDSVNAWRHIASVSNPRNRAVSLILSGWQIASDKTHCGGGDLQSLALRPEAADVAKIETRDPAALVAALDAAIRRQDQAQACAIVRIHGDQNFDVRPVVDTLLKYGVSEDGALHAEKYFQTSTEEFARQRPAFRWRQMVALARVTASEYGRPAAGMDEARKLLKV